MINRVPVDKSAAICAHPLATDEAAARLVHHSDRDLQYVSIAIRSGRRQRHRRLRRVSR
jgi:hypothetical protein